MIRRFVSTAVLAVAVLAPTLVTATSHAELFHNVAATSTAKVKNVKT